MICGMRVFAVLQHKHITAGNQTFHTAGKSIQVVVSDCLQLFLKLTRPIMTGWGATFLLFVPPSQQCSLD